MDPTKFTPIQNGSQPLADVQTEPSPMPPLSTGSPTSNEPIYGVRINQDGTANLIPPPTSDDDWNWF